MKKISDWLFKASHVLELIMGLFVFIAILVNLLSLIQDLGLFWNTRMEEGAFIGFLNIVLGMVIGIEFLKMLLKPNSETIIEVLMFVIARHMVVGSTTSVEDLLSVISVGILLLFHVLLKDDKGFEILKKKKPESVEAKEE